MYQPDAPPLKRDPCIMVVVRQLLQVPLEFISIVSEEVCHWSCMNPSQRGSILMLIQKPQHWKPSMVAIMNHRPVQSKKSTYVSTRNLSTMILFIWAMKISLKNYLEMNISKICRQLGIPLTLALGSSSDIKLMKCSILLWHNSLWPNSPLKILCAACATDFSMGDYIERVGYWNQCTYVPLTDPR